jgi:hypothetical protein
MTTDGTQDELCPDCHHRWLAHRGRNGGERCDWHMGPTGCYCRRKNPGIEAEDRLAGALWRAWTGSGGSR